MALRASRPSGTAPPLSLLVADYNPTVLQLVTLPNLLLAWALAHKDTSPALREALSDEKDIELTPQVLAAFESYLIAEGITLSFVSGGWSPEFVELLYSFSGGEADVMVLGAETIYSPFALNAFVEIMFALLRREDRAVAVVAAKRLYFGVGGSLDDFIEKAKALGADVVQLREEADGVRRGVVQCTLRT